MLRSIALGCVDRRSKPVDSNVSESLEDVLDVELDMGDGESASNDAGVGQGRSGKTKLNVKNVMKSHLQGTKRVRTCLFLTPIVMLLVMFTRPLYAPLIDVFGPTEQELKARATSGAAAEARARFERPRGETGGGGRRLLRADARTTTREARSVSTKTLNCDGRERTARGDDARVRVKGGGGGRDESARRADV
jgi:hypothetical protein